MRSRWERKLDRVLRRVRKRAARDVTKAGAVRGFHGGCPAVDPRAVPKPQGMYALEPDGEGGVWCTACGTTDLLPTATALDEARRAGLID